MTTGLMALEQSLARKRKAENCKVHGKAEGLNVPPPAQLRQQIEVVQGKRVGRPSNGLRALEDRLLGKAPQRQSNQAQLQTQRLDHGQAPVAVPAPSVPQPRWPPQPASVHPQRNSSIPSEQSYAPEFSAPEVGRFLVEPFSEPTSPEQLFKPAPSVSQPSTPPHLTTQPTAERRLSPATVQQPNAGPSLLQDGDRWIQQAQLDRPQKISQASCNALNANAALAKEDFERDLAAILGHSPQPQAPAAAPQAQHPQNAVQQRPAAVPDPNAPPPHPSHDVFDQMGLGMKYANSFDLGEVALQERFNQFDRSLLEQSRPRNQKPAQAQSLQSPFVSPMDLDDFELVAELAEISAEHPQLAQAARIRQKQGQQALQTTAQQPPAMEREQPAGQVPVQQIADNNQTEDTAG